MQGSVERGTKKVLYKEGERMTLVVRNRISHRLLQDEHSCTDFSLCLDC